MCSAKRTTLCRAFQSWLELFPYHNEMHWVHTFYGPWIESFQDCWWDPEFPQLSQIVQSLPGFLDLRLNVFSPSQVLWDVYTELLEAAHPLHRGPTDHKRSVGPLLSLPVHNQDKKVNIFCHSISDSETHILYRFIKHRVKYFKPLFLDI